MHVSVCECAWSCVSVNMCMYMYRVFSVCIRLTVYQVVNFLGCRDLRLSVRVCICVFMYECVSACVCFIMSVFECVFHCMLVSVRVCIRMCVSVCMYVCQYADLCVCSVCVLYVY